MLLAYLAFVLKIGPAFMKNRPAMELRNSMIVYNGVQVLFSMFLVWKVSNNKNSGFFLMNLNLLIECKLKYQLVKKIVCVHL